MWNSANGRMAAHSARLRRTVNRASVFSTSGVNRGHPLLLGGRRHTVPIHDGAWPDDTANHGTGIPGLAALRRPHGTTMVDIEHRQVGTAARGGRA